MSNSMQISPSQTVLMRMSDSLELLGAPTDVQLCYLASLGLADSIDELALQFDDLLPAVAQLRAAGVISDEATTSLHQLDAELAAMSGPENEALWTEWALRTAPNWLNVRQRARRSLIALNQRGQPRVESA